MDFFPYNELCSQKSKHKNKTMGSELGQKVNYTATFTEVSLNLALYKIQQLQATIYSIYNLS